jgi:hypothetical protein
MHQSRPAPVGFPVRPMLANDSTTKRPGARSDHPGRAYRIPKASRAVGSSPRSARRRAPRRSRDWSWMDARSRHAPSPRTRSLSWTRRRRRPTDVNPPYAARADGGCGPAHNARKFCNRGACDAMKAQNNSGVLADVDESEAMVARSRSAQSFTAYGGVDDVGVAESTEADRCKKRSRPLDRLRATKKRARIDPKRNL